MKYRFTAEELFNLPEYKQIFISEIGNPDDDDYAKSKFKKDIAKTRNYKDDIFYHATGGVNDKNLAEYISAPFIHAVGGSWLCAKADIAAHNFDKITSLCKEARKTALGFEIAHVGVNAGDAEESLSVCRALDAAFGFGVKEGNSSNFAGSGVEVMKSPYLGKNGHIAVKTNSIPRAAAELAKNGFTLDESTAKYKGEKMVAVYLKQEFGGFAVHLLQK